MFSLVVQQSRVTFYGFPDNDPANSDAIAFPRKEGFHTLHSRAGGMGSWRSPITFAAGKKWLASHGGPGTRIWVPYLSKYFILEDTCASCSWSNWVDLWIDGRGYPKSTVLVKEDYLTKWAGTIIHINPPSTHKASTQPLMEVILSK